MQRKNKIPLNSKIHNRWNLRIHSRVDILSHTILLTKSEIQHENSYRKVKKEESPPNEVTCIRAPFYTIIIYFII